MGNITLFVKIAGGDIEEVTLPATANTADLLEELGLDDRYSVRNFATGAPLSASSTLTNGLSLAVAKNLEGGC